MDTSLLFESIGRHIQLDEWETELTRSLFKVRHLRKKDFLLRPGEVCRTENFILKGCVKEYTLDPNGSEHILMFGIEGWWTCDLLSFLTGQESHYYIEALEDTTLVQIQKPDLDALYERVPGFERFFRIILQNAFIAHLERIEQNLSMSAEERYLAFNRKYPAFEKRIPLKQVAAYLGITPVFLSMLRSKMRRN